MTHNIATVCRVPFAFHADGGHGWLAVGSEAMACVGLREHDLSRYSYRSHDRGWFYLEEDCDAGKFLRAFETQYGCKPEIVDHYHKGDCFIRSLPRIYTDAEYAAHNRAFCS